MAQLSSDLPCDGNGVCMVCKSKPSDGETLTCKTCATPWHGVCLAVPLKTLSEAAQWECPDCSDLSGAVTAVVSGGGLVEKIRAIECNASMTDQEKAKRRQELLSGANASDDDKEKKKSGDVLEILGDKFNCSICMHLLDRPVSTPCGHNFCLKCFLKMVGQNGKNACAFCRREIPLKMAREPRINSAIVIAIRMAKLSQFSSSVGVPKLSHYIHNHDRPDKAFTTERAKKTGKANACSGKIFVTIAPDHFGPITAEYDPERNQGVLVGEFWEDRMECRQWGVHFPHVAGISGQADYGAQSVALSGGYEDDEDNGEWFLYTGSGGRDLSGNKRTNKKQSFDQKFIKYNEALRVSCRMGYPVRVVRSHKEKRSSYAPQEGVRYDGVYRIEKCWRKEGIQGFKVCRYLFVRCDNEPAPWTSDTNGDCPRPLPVVEELKHATDITERKSSPAWDYDGQQGRWIWKKPPPESRRACGEYDAEGKITVTKKRKHQGGGKERLLREFGCLICRKVMELPVTTPCAHNFCKACLEGAFAGQSFLKQRSGTRTLRTQKNVMKCPSCPNDISDFIRNPQVNRELMNVIESLVNKMKEENMETEDTHEESDGTDEHKNSENAEDDADLEVINEDMHEKSDGMDEDIEQKTDEKAEDDAHFEIIKDGKHDKSDVAHGDITLIVEDKEKCQNAEILKEGRDGEPLEDAKTDKTKRTLKLRKAGEEACALASDTGKKQRVKKT